MIEQLLLRKNPEREFKWLIFQYFLGNHVRPITDPLKLRFLLFVIHNQKDLN